MPYSPDPDNANVRHAARALSAIVWRYVATHTKEECEELKRRADAEIEVVRRAFKPVPVIRQDDTA